MKIRLHRDLHEWRDGKLIVHKKGTEVDLQPHVAEWVNQSVIERRKSVRSIASKFSFTPEGK
jgi:hypothetical protein